MAHAQEEYFNNSVIGSITFPAMAAGVATQSAAITQVPPFGPNSQVLGFQRITSGGTVGTPFLAGIDVLAAAPFTETLTIKASVNTDTSVYKLYYVNPVPQDAVKSALSLV